MVCFDAFFQVGTLFANTLADACPVSRCVTVLAVRGSRMQNALLVGLSRQVALRRELDVVANNVANMNTNGYKSQSMLFRDHMKNPASAEHFKKQDRAVHFVVDQGTLQNFSQGPMEQTGGTFHMALREDDTFFVVQNDKGETRYTRAGNFERNSQGKLVTLSGEAVQGTSGELVFSGDETDVAIGADGSVTTNLGSKGRVKVVRFAQLQKLENVGDNLFIAKTETPADAIDARVQQGYLEKSNVRPVKEMSRMIEVNRAYAGVVSIMDKMNEQQKNAIDKLAMRA